MNIKRIVNVTKRRKKDILHCVFCGFGWETQLTHWKEYGVVCPVCRGVAAPIVKDETTETQGKDT